MTRLRLAFSLFRCALFHNIQTRKGWLRCVVCSPVRRRRPEPNPHEGYRSAEPVCARVLAAATERNPQSNS